LSEATSANWELNRQAFILHVLAEAQLLQQDKEAGQASRPVQDFEVAAPARPGRLHITAALNYRKVDQYLLNFLLGEDNQLTSPVIEMTRVEKTLEIRPAVAAGEPEAEAAQPAGAGG